MEESICDITESETSKKASDNVVLSSTLLNLAYVQRDRNTDENSGSS